MGMTQRDVVGREVGGRVDVWDRMYTRGGFMSMYGKTNTVLQNKVKIKIKKKIVSKNHS